MSGLQASISTHIAKEYYYPDGRWDTNIPLFVRAVGSHPDRISNLYFTFLFVLRAVVKAGGTLTDFPFHTGNQVDDKIVRTLIRKLVEAKLPNIPSKLVKERITEDAGQSVGELPLKRVKSSKKSNDLEQCRNGFDESVLFQVINCFKRKSSHDDMITNSCFSLSI